MANMDLKSSSFWELNGTLNSKLIPTGILMPTKEVESRGRKGYFSYRNFGQMEFASKMINFGLKLV